jgi:serine/threonine protein kinase
MQKGGGKKKNKEKTGFTPVEDMIKSPDTTFDVLTADSLFGFMVTMEVSRENAEYLGRSRGGVKLNNPITQYLLKISVIDVTRHYLEPIVLDGRGHNKSSESATDFCKEAMLQQRLWLESIVGGKVPVCPDVYNVSYNCGNALFRSARQSASSTASFSRREVSKYPQVHDYLVRYHNSGSSAKIGAIAMEYIPNSRTLYEVMYPDVEEAFKRKALITAGAQVLRLFLNHAVVHNDLHLGNVLVDKTGMSYIIDFGIVVDLADATSRYYVRYSPFNLMESRRAYNAFFQEQRPNRMDPEGDRADIETTCLEIIEKLMRAEKAIFRRCQMDFLYDELKSRNLFYEVGLKYKELSSSSSGAMSQKAISKKIENGEIELITDAGLGEALIQQLPFLQPTYASDDASDVETVPLATAYLATAPLARTDETIVLPDTEQNNAIGITKKKRFRVIKRKKQKKTKRRR